MWPKGTLCITIAANIAKTGLLNIEACFPDSVVGFASNDKSNVRYVQYWLSFIQKIIEDSAPMAAQKNINLKILRELDIPLPPKELQDNFERAVLATASEKAKATLAAERSNSLFESLLQRAFNGELVTGLAA